jgi:hypothetical protein
VLGHVWRTRFLLRLFHELFLWGASVERASRFVSRMGPIARGRRDRGHKKLFPASISFIEAMTVPPACDICTADLRGPRASVAKMQEILHYSWERN